MKKIFVFVCAALTTLSVAAQSNERPWSVGLYGGKVEAANDWGSHFFHPASDFYGSASFSVERYLNNRFDVGVHALWGRYGTKGGDFNPTDGEFKAGLGFGAIQGKYKFLYGEKFKESLLHPFAFISLGARAIYGLDKDDNSYETTTDDNKAISFALGGGLGCDLRINDAFSIRYFATYGYPIGNGDKPDNRVCGDYADQHLLHNLGIVYSFCLNKDRDNDGVENSKDECPDNTPEEISKGVNEKGCPKDSDEDGFPDYLDKCPFNTVDERSGGIDSTGCPKDNDGDGVANYQDECPDNTAEELAKGVDEKGCPKDSDGDGVPDYKDECPDTPAGANVANGMVDEKGCPKDTDGDGVADFEDVCPDVAGVKENKGCPEIKEEVKKVFEKALNGIEFETGSAKIKKSSNKILDDVVKIMKENPSYKLSINGHTDNVGKAEKNQKLSEDRAAAVKAYLESKGVEAARLSSAGFGQDQPVADNKTKAGRAKNRRVEFKVRFEK